MNKEGRIKGSGKINSFEDLIAWQKGHAIVLQIYKTTREFPKEEKFNLISQMRRCAVSITSNIAEGFGRLTKNNKNRFYLIANGSIKELTNQLLIAKDLRYLSREDYLGIREDLRELEMLLQGLIRSTKRNF